MIIKIVPLVIGFSFGLLLVIKVGGSSSQTYVFSVHDRTESEHYN